MTEEPDAMTEKEMTNLLQLLFDEIGMLDEDEIDLAIDGIDCESRLVGCRTQTFEDCGLLTNDDGVVLSLDDGSEFQVTIVRSK